MTTSATTNKLHSIKDQKEQKVSDLLKTCTVFFAFSTEQFEKNKTPLQEGEKYVHIGAGGYMPKSKAESFKTGLDEIEKWYKSALKSSRLRKQNIAYELNNHEAYYTMDIQDTLDALGDGYTYEEVHAVFMAERKKQVSKY